MEKINIMHLRSSSAGFYGAEGIILELCKNIDKEKFNCCLACFKDPRLHKISLIEEAQKNNLRTEVINLAFRFDIFAIVKLKGLLAKYNIDILHCHDYKANLIGFLASRFKRVNLVTTLHGWTKANLKVRCYEYLDAIIMKNFNKIIVVSNQIREDLLKKNFTEQKIIVIHNAVDVSYFGQKTDDALRYKEKFGISGNCRIIGTVGRLSSEKGQKYLIEAAEEVLRIFPEVVFLLVGDGAEGKMLKNIVYAKGLEKHIAFAGFCPVQEMKNMYSLMDIFILPSLTEGISLVLLEAMAMGIPVIATKVGGTNEIIEHGRTGYLIPPADKQAISEAIINLLNDEITAQSIAKAGQDRVKKEFSVNRMVKEIEEAYRGLVGK